MAAEEESEPSVWFWTGHGFWQLQPSTFRTYELPDLTPEEQIAAASRYVKRMYGS